MIFSTINQPYHHLVTLLSDAESFLEVTVEQTQNQGIIKPSPQPSTSPSNSNINNLKKKKKSQKPSLNFILVSTEQDTLTHTFHTFRTTS